MPLVKRPTTDDLFQQEAVAGMYHNEKPTKWDGQRKGTPDHLIQGYTFGALEAEVCEMRHL